MGKAADILDIIPSIIDAIFYGTLRIILWLVGMFLTLGIPAFVGFMCDGRKGAIWALIIAVGLYALLTALTLWSGFDDPVVELVGRKRRSVGLG